MFVKGFPNIGYLIIIFCTSMVFLLSSYYFFYLMMLSYTTGYKIPLDKSIFSACVKNAKREYTYGQTDNIFVQTLIGGVARPPISLLFNLVVLFYLSVVIVIATTYLSTLECEMFGSTAWLFIMAITSLALIFIFNVGLYELRKRGYVLAYEWINIGIFAVASIALLLGMLVLPRFEKTATTGFSWWSYLYPIGMIVGYLVIYYFSVDKIGNWFLRLLALIAIGIFFFFIPYVVSYVRNHYNLCAD